MRRKGGGGVLILVFVRLLLFFFFPLSLARENPSWKSTEKEKRSNLGPAFSASFFFPLLFLFLPSCYLLLRQTNTPCRHPPPTEPNLLFLGPPLVRIKEKLALGSFGGE